MTIHKDTLPSIITNIADLRRLADRLQGERLLACDLEGDSLHHYQERVCLVQVSVPGESYVIDPLTVKDMSPLAPLMGDSSIRKVFHGADYDIRSLYRDFSIEVSNLFDTMVACQLLGEKEVGLAAVLKKRFGVELDKRFQKADWSRRPLSQEMIDYAMQDTSLLIDLHRQLEDELRDKGRLPWLEEECELLSLVRPAVRDTEPSVLKFKGAARMDSRTLGVLEELLRFRDEKARRRDVPPFKVVGNDQLRLVAEKKPRKLGDLKELPGMPRPVVERYGKDLLDAVERGLARGIDSLPKFPKSPRISRDPRQEALLKKLKQWRESKAECLQMDPGLVANNALLEAVVEIATSAGGPIQEITQLKKWQMKEFGEDLLMIVRGA